MEQLFTDTIDFEMEALVDGNLKDNSMQNRRRIWKEFISRYGCKINEIIDHLNRAKRPEKECEHEFRHEVCEKCGCVSYLPEPKKEKKLVDKMVTRVRSLFHVTSEKIDILQIEAMAETAKQEFKKLIKETEENRKELLKRIEEM